MGAVDSQYLLVLPFSLNIVPPTATLNAVEARKFTDIGFVAGATLGSSQDVAPLSPEETKYVIPCAAACSAKALWPANCASVANSSQALKLSVMISARLFSIM